jgi:hypothetical protein
MKYSRTNEQGVVSIFVVIFCALFVAIITVSFVGIMIRNQIQSTNADLSNSAYDAALAGVEDAKRLLVTYKSCQSQGFPAGNCQNVKTAIETRDAGNWSACNTLNVGLSGDSSTDERLIQRIEGSASPSVDTALDQATTCVKIRYDGPVEDFVKDQDVHMIPIETNNNATYSKVKISWFLKKSSSNSLGFYGGRASLTLPAADQWDIQPNKDVPPVLRVQFMQVGQSFTLDSFDKGDGTKSNANTLLLYPSDVGGVGEFNLATLDYRDGASGTKQPQPVVCSPGIYGGSGYACSVTLNLPAPIDGTENDRQAAYLRIGSIYSGTDYAVELLDSGNNSVSFNGVRPQVDSTGRAADQFRRVKASIKFAGSFDYPKATVETKGNVCKTFGVTDLATDFQAGLCRP